MSQETLSTDETIKASQVLDQHLSDSIAQMSTPTVRPPLPTVPMPTPSATVLAQPAPAASAGTPNLNGLQGAFANFTKRVDSAALSLTKRMDSVATFTETAVEKFGGAVDKVEAQARAIDNAANQMTNGGPPLGNS